MLSADQKRGRLAGSPYEDFHEKFCPQQKQVEQEERNAHLSSIQQSSIMDDESIGGATDNAHEAACLHRDLTEYIQNLNEVTLIQEHILSKPGVRNLFNDKDLQTKTTLSPFTLVENHLV